MQPRNTSDTQVNVSNTGGFSRSEVQQQIVDLCRKIITASAVGAAILRMLVDSCRESQLLFFLKAVELVQEPRRFLDHPLHVSSRAVDQAHTWVKFGIQQSPRRIGGKNVNTCARLSC